jgi:hypothetical protein
MLCAILMKMKEQIIIPTSKKFISLALLGSVLFTVGGMYMFNAEPSEKYSSIDLRFRGFSTMAFFGLAGLYCLIKLFDNKPGLIIDENGIWNNSSIISNHTIKWNELSGAGLTKFGREKIIFLYFKDNKSFIIKFNLIERFIMRLNLLLCDSPIGISTRSLKYDIKKLEQQIQYRIKNWA